MHDTESPNDDGLLGFWGRFWGKFWVLGFEMTLTMDWIEEWNAFWDGFVFEACSESRNDWITDVPDIWMEPLSSH